MLAMISEMELKEISGSVTKHMTFYSQSFLVTFITCIILYGAPGRMRCLIAGVINTQKINLVLNMHDCSSPGKHFERLIYFLPMNVIFSMVDSMIFSQQALKSSPLWVILIIYFTNLSFVVIELSRIQFMILVMYVRSSFTSIKERLKALGSLFPGKTSNFHHDAVRNLKAAYESACDMIDDVNSCHGLLLVMLVAHMFTRLIFSMFYFITNLSIEESIRNQNMFIAHQILQLYWCVFEVIKLMMYIEPCHLTYKEIQDIRVLVGLLMHHTRSVGDPLAVDLEQFSTQLILQKVSYAPLDIITIKRSLLIKVLGNITTYLVILIHMK